MLERKFKLNINEVTEEIKDHGNVAEPTERQMHSQRNLVKETQHK
jgi:hypothetical protein